MSLIFDHDDINRLDIEIYRGCDFELIIEYKNPLDDITGYKYKSKIIDTNTGLPVATFHEDDFAVDAVAKQVIMTMDESRTTGITAGTNYLYDVIEITPTEGQKPPKMWGYVKVFDVAANE